MGLSIAFWIVFLLWAILGWYPPSPPNETGRWPTARNILLVLLFLIVGLGIFGNPIQGK